jgi:glycosyltransferase involved in cell wall biosynthesis
MLSNKPCVSIGLPVYNGEQFLKETLDAILAQTFGDFELIISDNASTDRTEEICKEYAAKDRRIRYYRNKENLGAGWNNNRVFELCTGEYFKWNAHDDVCAPEFIEQCINVLVQDPTVVLCYPKVTVIDEQGKFLSNWNGLNCLVPPQPMMKLDSPQPHERFGELVAPHMCYPIFGLIRASALKMTPLLGCYSAADNVLLARLGLIGRFYEVPEYLFYSRSHPQQSYKVCDDDYKYAEWWDPKNKGQIILPHWKILAEYLHAINSTPLSWVEKAYCYAHTFRFIRWFRPLMIKELLFAGKQLLERRSSNALVSQT